MYLLIRGNLTSLNFLSFRRAIAFIVAFITGVGGIFSTAKADIKYIPNKGQWDEKVEYRAQLSHGRFYLQKGGFTYNFLSTSDLERMHHVKALEGSVRAHCLKVRFQGAQNPELTPLGSFGPKYNFYLGSNPENWASGLSAYQRVKYQGLYQGIDLEVTSKGASIKYNFEVSRGADPTIINLKYHGADTLYLDAEGNLIVQTSVNEYSELTPKAYQKIDGKRQPVSCDYRLNDNELSFHFPNGYDASYPLIIDPQVIFSTFSGSNADNFGYSAAFDSSGHGYSGGTVFGSDFEETSGAFQVNWGDGSPSKWASTGAARDVGILKYNDSGTKVKYATFLGGSGNEDPHSMIVNDDQDLLVFGNTESKDFPVTSGAYDTSFNGGYDIYMAKLSADGSTLKASTYLGGQDLDGLNGRQLYKNFNEVYNVSDLGWNYGDIFRGEVITNQQGDVLVATTTQSGQTFPTTSNAFQKSFGGGDQDGCVFRLSPNLQTLEASSFIGGSEDDAAYSLTLASDQSLLVTGGTKSSQLNFPVQGYQQQNNGGKGDAMILRTSSDLSRVKASTFLGTSKYDQAYFVQTGPGGNVYLTGQTISDQFPYKGAAYNVDSGKQFITKFNKQLDSLLLSSTFGSGLRSDPDLSPSAFLVDTCGKIYFSGWGGSTNLEGGNTGGLPTTKGAFVSTTDSSDFYIAVFARDMEALLYATYYGGKKSSEHVDGGTSRFDKSGIIYQSICAGCGGNSDLPTTQNAYSRTNNSGNCNNALLKINLQVEDVFSGLQAPDNTCIEDSISFQNQARLADSFVWYFGDGDTSHGRSPTHKYSKPGTYTVKQIAINPFSCDFADTAVSTISVYDKPGANFKTDTGECINVREFEYNGDFGDSFKWQFGDGSSVTGDSIVQHTYEDSGSYEVTCIVDGHSLCADTVSDTVLIKETVAANFSYSLDSCSGTVSFSNQSTNAKKFIWYFEGQQQFQVGKGNVQHQYSATDTFYPRLVAAPGKVCADTVIDTLRLDNVLSNFSYTITDPCEFRVSLKNSSALQDTVTWQLPDTTIHAVDSAKIQLPGAGDNQVAMWIKGAPPFCRDTSRQTITFDSVPKVNFTANHPTCEPYLQVNPDTTNLRTIRWHLEGSDAGFDTSYMSLAAGQRLPLPASEPSYKVIAIGDPNSQCSDTVIKRIPVDSLAEAAFSLLLDTCNQKLITKNQSPKGLQFRWRFGDGTTSSKLNPVHKYQNTGSFPVTLYAEDGLCKDTLTQNFQVLPIPNADYLYQRDTCSATVNFTSKSNADHPHLWTFDNGDTSQKVNPVKTYQQKGERKVQLIVGPTKGACADTVEQVVPVPDFVEARLDVIRARCKPRLTLNATTNNADSLTWEGDIQPYLEKDAGDSVVVNLPEAGDYWVKVIAFSEQCQDTAQQKVLANPAIEADFTFEQVPCRPEFNFQSKEPGANKHLWLLGNSVQKEGAANFNYTYQQSGRYEVTYIADPADPCADTAQKTLVLSPEDVQPLEIPNVFTPNGDGVNDYFEVKGLSDCKDFELFIYNRWGQLVYKAKDEDLKWDGKDINNDNPLASGTYYFSIKGPRFQKQGTITLIRDD